MFFVGLSISFILIAIGVVLLLEASYVLGGVLLGIGFLSLILLGIYYSSRRKKNIDCDCFDCAYFASFTDCDCIGRRKGLDCDCDFCSPD